MKQIYVNGRFLTQRRTGVERYAYELCRAMVQIGMQFTIVCPRQPIAQDYDVSMFHIVRYGVGASHLWEQCVLPFFFIGKRDYLVLSFTGLGSILVPNKIMTIHDLSFLENRSWFSKAYYYYYKLMTPLAVRTSKAVITVSEFSKKEILRFYPFVRKDRIHVVYNACNAASFTVSRNDNPEEQYALAVSSIDPRKNLPTLIRAFADAAIGCKLYVVGNHNKVFAGQDGVDFSSDNVEFLGRVDDDRLSRLYAEARCFVSSSLYEGFGLPLLESMTCGCPVVCSDIPVYHEVCGDSALYFNPLSADDLRSAVRQMINLEGAEREKLQQAMQDNLQRFSWISSAQTVSRICQAE